RVTCDQGQSAEECKRRCPVERTAAEGAVAHGNSLNETAEDHTLREGRESRADIEGNIPAGLAVGNVAKFKCHTAKNQRQKHHDDGQVERRHDDRIRLGKCHKQTSAPKYEPGLVTVPVRSNRTRHLIAFALGARGRKKYADAQIEAVEKHVHEYGGAEQGRPDQGEVPFHDVTPFNVALPHVRRLAPRKSGSVKTGLSRSQTFVAPARSDD